MLPPGFTVRPARDDDADALITLIGDVFAEYPGCVLDVDGEIPELRAIATAFAALGGRFDVVVHEGSLRACVGSSPTRDGLELRKLYVARAARRVGLGAWLCGHVEAMARAQGARSVELWTDTRFVDAHRLYERLGYVRQAATRELHDRSDTIEYHYRKVLVPGR